MNRDTLVLNRSKTLVDAKSISPTKVREATRPTLVFYGALALVFLLGLGGCTGAGQQVAKQGLAPDLGGLEKPLSFATLKVKPVLVGTSIAYPGTVKARRQALLATKLSGRITFLSAQEGEVFEKGALLATVDATDIEARTRQALAGQEAASAILAQSAAGRLEAERAVALAQAQLKALSQQEGEAQALFEVAAKDFKRYQNLAALGAAPQQQADHALSQLEVARSRQKALQSQLTAASVAISKAEAGVNSARGAEAVAEAQIELARAAVDLSASDLNYAQLHSPFRGVVVEKLAYQGELSSPGRPLLKLADLSSLEVALSLPETALDDIRRADTFLAQAPALKKEIKLSLGEIVAATDALSRRVEVRLKFSSIPSELFPGSYVKVLVPAPPQEKILVPESAVVRRGQLEGVFVLGGDNIAQFRLLQLAEVLGGKREVLSGLSQHDTIILDPSQELSEGRRVVSK